MELIDNINRLLGDDLKKSLKPGARLKVAASCFSMYALEALKGELEQVDELHFIFTSPTFVAKEVTDKIRKEFHIPKLNRERSLCGSEFEIHLCNKCRGGADENLDYSAVILTSQSSEIALCEIRKHQDALDDVGPEPCGVPRSTAVAANAAAVRCHRLVGRGGAWHPGREASCCPFKAQASSRLLGPRRSSFDSSRWSRRPAQHPIARRCHGGPGSTLSNCRQYFLRWRAWS